MIDTEMLVPILRMVTSVNNWLTLRFHLMPLLIDALGNTHAVRVKRKGNGTHRCVYSCNRVCCFPFSRSVTRKHILLLFTYKLQ